MQKFGISLHFQMFVYAHTDINLVKIVLSITLQQTYSLDSFLNSFGVAREQKEHGNKGKQNNQNRAVTCPKIVLRSKHLKEGPQRFPD